MRRIRLLNRNAAQYYIHSGASLMHPQAKTNVFIRFMYGFYIYVGI